MYLMYFENKKTKAMVVSKKPSSPKRKYRRTTD